MALKNLEELKRIVDELRKKGKRIVFTNGCYDVIHRGHVYILQEMAKLGDVFIIGLNSDESVKRFKGLNRPINNQEDRAFVVSGIKGVDYVVIFEEDDPINLIEVIRPEVHVKGGAGLIERIEKEKELVESYGGEMVCLDLIEGYSSSEVIGRING